MSSAEIKEYIIALLSDGMEHTTREMQEYISRNDTRTYSDGQFSGSVNTLVRTNKIKNIRRGVYALNREDGEMSIKKCFVVSPIGEQGSNIRNNADKLFKYIIEPVCKACSFTAERVDQSNDNNYITDAIINKLDKADLVIADISNHNPNVFFEMGYRTRTKKPIIHLKPKNEELPFDIASIRTFDYDLTDLDSVSEIKKRLEQTISSMTFTDKNAENTIVPIQTTDDTLTTILSVLYEVSDKVANLQNDMKSNNSETISSIIKSMQNTQPKLSPEVELQSQMMNAFMQNPEGMMRLAELSKIIDKK